MNNPLQAQRKENPATSIIFQLSLQQHLLKMLVIIEIKLYVNNMQFYYNVIC